MLRRTFSRSAAVLNAAGVPTAATVLACRCIEREQPEEHDYELLFIKRSKQMKFMPNLFAFPGGKVDPEDVEVAKKFGGLKWAPERFAVMRELAEEVGLLVRPDGTLASDESVVGGKNTEPLNATSYDNAAIGALVPFQQWVTPKEEIRRFDTAFFLLPCTECTGSTFPTQLFPNEGEIAEARWLSPMTASLLHNQAESQFRLPPPTQIIIHMLCQPKFRSMEALVTSYREHSDDLLPINPTVDVSEETGDFWMKLQLSAMKPGFAETTEKTLVGDFGYPVPDGFLKGKQLSDAAKANTSPKMFMKLY